MNDVWERFWSKVDSSGGPEACWPYTSYRGRKGYGRFYLRGSEIGAHRAAYELTYGPIPNGMLVCHRCDNPPCCNPAHLFLGSESDNRQDMWAKRRREPSDQTGVRNHNAKLTPEQVREIRWLYASGGRTTKQLGAAYGVHHSTIHAIVKYKAWSTLSEP